MLDRESRRQQRAIALGLGLLILFIVSGVKSCTEMKYSAWGETVDARIKRTYEDEGRIVVLYRFQDRAGEWREGSGRVRPDDWTAPADHAVEVVYLPGSPDTSSMVVARSLVFPIIFGIMLALVIAWCVHVYLQAKKGIFG